MKDSPRFVPSIKMGNSLPTKNKSRENQFSAKKDSNISSYLEKQTIKWLGKSIIGVLASSYLPVKQKDT